MLLLGALLFLTGVILVSFGLVAELLVRTYHESQGKPTYLVSTRR
jgi:dolichol-phosphate mannosyltransferase